MDSYFLRKVTVLYLINAIITLITCKLEKCLLPYLITCRICSISFFSFCCFDVNIIQYQQKYSINHTLLTNIFCVCKSGSLKMFIQLLSLPRIKMKTSISLTHKHTYTNTQELNTEYMYLLALTCYHLVPHDSSRQNIFMLL